IRVAQLRAATLRMIVETPAMVTPCPSRENERGWSDNPLVYCDGLSVQRGSAPGLLRHPHYPRWLLVLRARCESNERVARVPLQSSGPSRSGALKRTDRAPGVTSFNRLLLHLRVRGQSERAVAGGLHCSATSRGCRLCFHVTCARHSACLCEESEANGSVRFWRLLSEAGQARLGIKAIPAYISPERAAVKPGTSASASAVANRPLAKGAAAATHYSSSFSNGAENRKSGFAAHPAETAQAETRHPPPAAAGPPPLLRLGAPLLQPATPAEPSPLSFSSSGETVAAALVSPVPLPKKRQLAVAAAAAAAAASTAASEAGRQQRQAKPKQLQQQPKREKMEKKRRKLDLGGASSPRQQQQPPPPPPLPYVESTDIASLLTCLHQLQKENRALEQQIGNLQRRKDRLQSLTQQAAAASAAVTARLSCHFSLRWRCFFSFHLQLRSSSRASVNLPTDWRGSGGGCGAAQQRLLRHPAACEQVANVLRPNAHPTVSRFTSSSWRLESSLITPGRAGAQHVLFLDVKGGPQARTCSARRNCRRAISACVLCAAAQSASGLSWLADCPRLRVLRLLPLLRLPLGQVEIHRARILDGVGFSRLQRRMALVSSFADCRLTGARRPQGASQQLGRPVQQAAILFNDVGCCASPAGSRWWPQSRRRSARKGGLGGESLCWRPFLRSADRWTDSRRLAVLQQRPPVVFFGTSRPAIVADAVKVVRSGDPAILRVSSGLSARPVERPRTQQRASHSATGLSGAVRPARAMAGSFGVGCRRLRRVSPVVRVGREKTRASQRRNRARRALSCWPRGGQSAAQRRPLADCAVASSSRVNRKKKTAVRRVGSLIRSREKRWKRPGGKGQKGWDLQCSLTEKGLRIPRASSYKKRAGFLQQRRCSVCAATVRGSCSRRRRRRPI
uniref:BZIP domain-containing protein n=1 Tax=Macrostomum lignano TaxID=282301 RepID=A0A1I8FHA7_9PLAT